MSKSDIFAPSLELADRMYSLDGPMQAAMGGHIEAYEGSLDFLALSKESLKKGSKVVKLHAISQTDEFIMDERNRKKAKLKAAGLDIDSWEMTATGKCASAIVLKDLGVSHIKSGGGLGIQNRACHLMAEHRLDDTFYIVDLGNVQRLFKAWRAAMPRVTPFYAVKCYPDVGVLRLLASMGAGFDCASKGELEMMLNMGVSPSRIIFAHPCKRPSDIRYARDTHVEYTTFDTESELHKIAGMHCTHFKLVLRIRADDPDARVPLGLKYGADAEDALHLLTVAQSLGLEVVGVSFHVGSACKNLSTFSMAIERARQVFDVATHLGFTMTLLDIGGGFSGRFDALGNVRFGDIATTINTALSVHFPVTGAGTPLRVIAEPGRYFAETAASLFTPVYGHRDRVDPQSGIRRKDYWITDGLYGSFNCMLYDGQVPEFDVVRSVWLPAPTAAEKVPQTSTVWGPTCDSADCVYKDVALPLLRNGDWLHFANAGAYTLAGACDFNGIQATAPNVYYVFSDCAVDAPPDEE